MEQDYKGIIIEESLEDPTVLKDLKILSTKVIPATKKHRTHWVQQWTMHTVQIPHAHAHTIAKKLSGSLDSKHAWYADFKSNTDHFIIFYNKIFHITDRTNQVQYDQATAYGLSLGIPKYQLDFSPHITQWDA